MKPGESAEPKKLLSPWLKTILFGVITGGIGFALLLTNNDGLQAQAGPSLHRATNGVSQSDPKQQARGYR
jgi:hypothetical protein